LTAKQRDNTHSKQVIMEIVETQNPQNTKQLIQIAQIKTTLTEQEIFALIVELESENKLKFIKQTPQPKRLRKYIQSNYAIWYWITISIAVATPVAVFTIDENTYLLSFIRNVIGIIFVLFLPGYAFIKLLFPEKVPIPTNNENIDNIERFALSFGVSLALTPLVGLILNYTPWGIRLTPITICLLSLTVIFATAAIVREYHSKTELPITPPQTMDSPLIDQ
jgi:hypothetical protein